MKRNIKINFINLLPILLMLGSIFYFTMIVLKFPLIGIEVREQNNHWIIEEVHKNGWASSQLIKKGDVLELVNDDKPEHHSTVKWFNRVEMVDSISILEESAQTKAFSVPYRKLDVQSIGYFIFPFLFSILALLFSVFLYWKEKKKNLSQLCFIFY